MGCRICRARKVKCDGRPNGCRNCERLQIECRGDDDPRARSSILLSTIHHEQSSLSSANRRKKRTFRSCISCRLSKTKCDGGRPYCSRCSARNTNCVYHGVSKPRWTQLLTPSTANRKHRPGQTNDKKSNRKSEDNKDSIRENKISSGKLSSRKIRLPTLEELGFISNEPLGWLLSLTLPAPRYVRLLVEHYFANIHPIRCFAFLNKSSFIGEKLPDSGDDLGLLHIICAHGARFYALSQFELATGSNSFSTAGNQWANTAEEFLMEKYSQTSIKTLMAAVLIHDYRVRLGHYERASMISRFAIGMAQKLGINSEDSADILCTKRGFIDLSPASRESRRRLMWACFLIDEATTRGSEPSTILQETDINLQLPCNEHYLQCRVASVTETLRIGHVLPCLSPGLVPAKPAINMGIMAYYIRINEIGKRIVKYNNTFAPSRTWNARSEFTALDEALTQWRRSLPDCVTYSTETVLACLVSNQLGSLTLMHCTYHHNYLNLYRTSMPGLLDFKCAPSMLHEHGETLKVLQAEAYVHAREISRLLVKSAEHGPRMLSDSAFPFFLYESSRVLLHYVARVMDSSRVDAKERWDEAVHAVEENTRLLRMMVPLLPFSDSMALTVQSWLSEM